MLGFAVPSKNGKACLIQLIHQGALRVPDQAARLSRWDGCFIRLLDGMLQAGALESTGGDYQLRIPTRIRALSVNLPSPDLPLGSDGAQLHY